MESAEILELPFPMPPDHLTGEQKNDFIISHFWDRLDIKDTIKTYNKDFLEINFVNFISFLPSASESGRKKALRNLYSLVSTDSTAVALFLETADLYLFEPNSPYYSEDAYTLFLNEFLKYDKIEEAHRSRYLWQLEVTQKNTPGSLASDFSFITSDGRKLSLLKWTPDSEFILLLFYDPDCDNCNNLISFLSENPVINRNIGNKQLSVLAIDPGNNKESWKKTESKFPDSWTVGLNDGDIEEEDIFILRALPSIYLLDRNKKIIGKDIRPQRIVDFLKPKP